MVSNQGLVCSLWFIIKVILYHLWSKIKDIVLDQRVGLVKPFLCVEELTRGSNKGDRSPLFFSLLPQRYNRVDAGGPSGGDIVGPKGYT